MKANRSTPEAIRLFLDGSIALAQIERNGVRVDTDYLEEAIGTINKRIKKIEKRLEKDKLHKMWRRRFGSRMKYSGRHQLVTVLKEAGLYKSKERTSTLKSKANKAVLEKIDHPFVRRYLRMESLKKTKATYLLGIKREMVYNKKRRGWYVHPSYNLHTVITFRSSCNSPNFQNNPVRNPELAELVRRCYIPPKGWHFVEIDFSAIEVRIAYLYHKDPNMLRYLTDKKTDMHRDMASECYMIPQEKIGKVVRYCNPVESPIWMWDMSFKPLGEIKVGDEVMGWERRVVTNTGKRGSEKVRKRMTKSIVTNIIRRKAKVYKVTLESGKVIRCTKDHRWLNGNMQFRGHDVFVKPKKGVTLAKIVDVVEKCPEDLQREAGWLAGMMDGEGTWPKIAQCPNHNPHTYKKLFTTADKLGFKNSVCGKNGGSGAGVYLDSKIDCAVKFLNWCKPVKKKRIRKNVLNRSSFIKKDKVVKVEYDSTEDVIGLTTTTGNYVAWGYASKNCGKNMFVFPQFYGSYYPDCAKHLWEAIDHLKLKVGKEGEGKSIKDHLAKKGIKKLGKCNPEHSPKRGTFEHHIKRVEEKFWNKTFPVFKNWRNKWFDAYLNSGSLSMKTGFAATGYYARNDVINYPVQGVAFHCLLWCLIQLQKWIKKKKLKSKIVGEIHDSIPICIPPKEMDLVLNKAVKIMTKDLPKHWKWITIPLEVEVEVAPIDKSWYDKKPWEADKNGHWSPAKT